MELTREEVEKFAKDDSCTSGKAYHSSFVAELAKQLLREMDRPDVWDGAPEWASIARVEYHQGCFSTNYPHGNTFTRTLPKSPVREIAERRSKVIVSTQMTERELIADQIEAAINEYKEREK